MSITQTDLEVRFGANNIKIWSNLENTSGAANTALIEAGINWAEDYVHNKLRASQYSVPLQPLSGELYQVNNWMVVLAGWFIYTARGLRDIKGPDADVKAAKLSALKDAVDDEIDAVIKGGAKLDAAASSSTSPSAPIAVGDAAPGVPGSGIPSTYFLPWVG
jgi:hypothetical protein